MNDYLDVPDGIVRRVRTACAHLPEAYEEQAHAGVRWRIRGNTLVHVVTRDLPEGAVTTMTFHSRGLEAEALVAMGHPFYPGWGGGLVAMVLYDDDKSTDWQEAKELLIESYCYLAPKKLIALLNLPDA